MILNTEFRRFIFERKQQHVCLNVHVQIRTSPIARPFVIATPRAQRPTDLYANPFAKLDENELSGSRDYVRVICASCVRRTFPTNPVTLELFESATERHGTAPRRRTDVTPRRRTLYSIVSRTPPNRMWLPDEYICSRTNVDSRWTKRMENDGPFSSVARRATASVL